MDKEGDAGTDTNADSNADAYMDTELDARTDWEQPLPAQLTLKVSAGMRLRSLFREDRDWQEELAVNTLVRLRPGDYSLPPRGQQVSAQLIQEILVGRDQNILQLTQEQGLLEEVEKSGPDQALRIFRYQQGFTLENQLFHLVLLVSVLTEQGGTSEIIVDRDSIGERVACLQFVGHDLIMGTLYSGPEEDWITNFISLVACDHLETHQFGMTFQGERGTNLTVQKTSCTGWESCDSGRTKWDCFLLTRAEVQIGEYTAGIDEPLRLIYSAGHHNSGEELLILLDPPAEDVFGLLLNYRELTYLDNNLDELYREKVCLVGSECVDEP